MLNDKMNISEVETYLHGLFKTVSDHSFVGNLPDTIKSSWNDMILINCDNGIRDFNGFGHGTALLLTYARPRSNGSKNVTRLKEMDSEINTIIKNQDSSGSYFISREKTYSDYDYSRNWHCNVIVLGITVK